MADINVTQDSYDHAQRFRRRRKLLSLVIYFLQGLNSSSTPTV